MEIIAVIVLVASLLLAVIATIFLRLTARSAISYALMAGATLFLATVGIPLHNEQRTSAAVVVGIISMGLSTFVILWVRRRAPE